MSGTGKTTIATTLARCLARRGHRVLAIDGDSNPNLALSLDLPAGEAERMRPMPARALTGSQTAADLFEQYAVPGPGGIRFLELGKLPHEVEPTVTVAFRYVVERPRRVGWTVVADLAAGTRQPMFGWARFAPTVLVVVDPSAKAMLTARRLVRAGVGTHVVANKVRDGADLAAIRDAVALPLLGCVPFDPSVIEAERRGQAPIDVAPSAPAVSAMRRLADALAGTAR